MFGARIGRGVVIKAGVRVKYPWLLEVGDHTWLGEDCWIDNLVTVTIGTNVCISQGAYLCTGNHDWKDTRFGLMVQPITIKTGAWVGARAGLAPGVTIGEGAVLTLGSFATRDIPDWEIHAGNPASCVGRRDLAVRDSELGVLS